MDRRKDASLQSARSLVFPDLPGNQHYGESGGRGYKDYRLWCARTLGSNARRLSILRALEMKWKEQSRIICARYGMCFRPPIWNVNWNMDVPRPPVVSKNNNCQLCSGRWPRREIAIEFRLQMDQESAQVVMIIRFKYETRDRRERGDRSSLVSQIRLGITGWGAGVELEYIKTCRFGDWDHLLPRTLY